MEFAKYPKMRVPNADKGKRKCDNAQSKCGSCSYSSLECVYTAQPNVDRNEVNLSSNLLMKNISDTKCIQDLSQGIAEIKEVLRTEPSTTEDYGKVI
jgi:hypothetical protein